MFSHHREANVAFELLGIFGFFSSYCPGNNTRSTFNIIIDKNMLTESNHQVMIRHLNISAIPIFFFQEKKSLFLNDSGPHKVLAQQTNITRLKINEERMHSICGKFPRLKGNQSRSGSK